MGPGEFLAIMAGILGGTAFMMTPVFIVRMVLKHREKMEAIRHPRPPGSGNAATQEVIAELRREMAMLRDTTTKFDMSFDAALARVENRLDVIEREKQQEEPMPVRHIETPRVVGNIEEPVAVLRR
jgi:hypothetical protein